MATSPASPAAAPARTADGAVGPYLRAIGNHKLVVLVCTLAALAGAVAWLAVREPTYEATAEILVTPLPQQDTTFQGLPFLRDYGEASRTIQTAAALTESPAAAQLTAGRLGPDWTRKRVEETVTVEPQGESSVLAVSAQASDAELAARVANTFVSSTLDARRTSLRRAVDAALERLREQQTRLSEEGRAQAAADLAQRIGALEAVRDGNDPTLSVAERAAVPTGALGAPAWLIALLAAIAGFTVGAGLAVVLETTDRRVRDEDELLALLPAPVLARSPVMGRRARRRQRSPTDIPPMVREAFRTLRVQLERQPGSHRTIMVTSASSGDGKTTSSINLALSLVGAGHRVVLMDFDLRKPELASMLGIEVERGLVATLTGTPLAELVTSPPAVPPLKVVAAAGAEGDVALLESLRRRLPSILEEARTLADYVVVDTAPLGEVADALTIADHVDDIVVVARPGQTNRVNLEATRDLLRGADLAPTGILIVGRRGGDTQGYYPYGTGAPERRPARRALARSR